MAERVKARSSVVVLETADSFVLEKRPNLPGKLAYPGKLQLFGGHRERDGSGEFEDAAITGARELKEEVDLEISPEALEPHWAGEYEGQDKEGRPVLRHVSVYHLCLTGLGRSSLRLKVQGEIADIPKTLEAIETLAEDGVFTPFALEVLRKLVKGE